MLLSIVHAGLGWHDIQAIGGDLAILGSGTM
jgi:hypothetical protein